MELKWLEDFVSLARTGSFSRSAEERNVTQPAFSRRIKALEAWLGVALIDRKTYPTTLTAAGREFRETAEESVRALHAGRAALQAKARPHGRTISVAALHTLALTFFPRWLKDIEAIAGPLSSRLLPDDFHSCVQALVEGGYDFLLTFHHPSAPVLLDPEQFPYLVVGFDSLVSVRAPGPEPAEALPRLAYAQNSFLGRVSLAAQAGASDAPTHTNENAMAEALKFMALEGHGLASLPHSLVERELADGRLIAIGREERLEVRLYRNAAYRRPAVTSVWRAAETAAAETMQFSHNRR